MFFDELDDPLYEPCPSIFPPVLLFSEVFDIYEGKLVLIVLIVLLLLGGEVCLTGLSMELLRIEELLLLLLWLFLIVLMMVSFLLNRFFDR